MLNDRNLGGTILWNIQIQKYYAKVKNEMKYDFHPRA